MGKMYDRAVKAYLNNCKSNEMSSGTIENYAKILRLLDESNKRHGYDEPTKQSIVDWKQDMSEDNSKYRDGHMRATTMSSYMNIAKNFFDWAVAMELWDKNPITPAILPSRKSVTKVQKRPYEKFLTPQEAIKVLNSERPTWMHEDVWLRNKAIIVMFITTAIRNSELRALTLDDLDFEKGLIQIRHGKGDKFRTVAFPDIAQDAVNNYLDSGFRPEDEPSSSLLFGVNSDDGWKEINRVSLSETVSRTMKHICGREDVRTHALRHTSATVMYDSGMAIDEISALLGHESVSTTEIYVSKLHPEVPSQHANNMFNNLLNNA